MKDDRNKNEAAGRSPSESDGVPNGQEQSPLKREVDAKARGTKQKIVQAAIREFAEHGLEGARIDRIARSARVNKAMIYYHFDSKDNLYKEVLVSFYRLLRDRARDTVLQLESLEEALLALARLHVEAVQSNPEIRPLVLRAMIKTDPVILDAIAEVFGSSGIPHRIMALLKQELGEGKIREFDMRQAMVSFVSMSMGYFAIAPMADRIFNVTDRQAFIQARPEIIVDIFLNGLRVR